MFPLRLLVFALFIHTATSEKEELETGDLSSWEASTNCSTFMNPRRKEHIEYVLNTTVNKEYFPTEDAFKASFRDLFCSMNVWNTPSDDFSEAIEKVKRRSEVVDWQIKLLDEADKIYREKRLSTTAAASTTSLSTTTSQPTTTTADWTKSCDDLSLSADLQRRCIEHDLKTALDEEAFEDDLDEKIDDLTKKMAKWDTPATVFSYVINKVKGSCCQGKEHDFQRVALNNVDREYRNQYNKKHHVILITTKATTTTTHAPGPLQSKFRIDVSSCSANGTACFYDRYCAEHDKASEKKIDMQPYANETVDTSKCPFVSIRRNPRPDGAAERFAVFQSPFDLVVIQVVWNERTISFHPEGDEIRCRPFCVVAKSHQTKTRNENSGLLFKQATIVLLKIQPVVTRRPSSKPATTRKPKFEKISIGSIILYSALGLLGLIILAVAAILLFQCQNRRRDARIRKNILKNQNVSKRPSVSSSSRGSGSDSGATLARASAECTPLLVSTPNAPTPPDQEARSERNSKPDRSVMKSLLTSPSVSHAHSLRTQMTQSTSEHQEVDSN